MEMYGRVTSSFLNLIEKNLFEKLQKLKSLILKQKDFLEKFDEKNFLIFSKLTKFYQKILLIVKKKLQKKIEDFKFKDLIKMQKIRSFKILEKADERRKLLI